ncbi:hypothetical protein [Amycolatopsis sp. NPDC059021]|uniref:hypothetical protein n=1 Tax=Amycolatopsis sp. NPDC059021 TaxID=3346704 RepID=UPI00366B4E44
MARDRKLNPQERQLLASVLENVNNNDIEAAEDHAKLLDLTIQDNDKSADNNK